MIWKIVKLLTKYSKLKGTFIKIIDRKESKESDIEKIETQNKPWSVYYQNFFSIYENDILSIQVVG